MGSELRGERSPITIQVKREVAEPCGCMAPYGINAADIESW